MMTEAKCDPSLIAIVDDEEDITTYIGLALEDNGYRVVSTTDPAGAIEMLAECRPDLICLDLLMPERTGVSLYANLVQHQMLGSIPIVILSGLAARDEMPDILLQGGNLPEPAAFIEKPVDMDSFLKTIRTLLDRPARSSS
jgi:CheY-like chemotaxis protein